MLIFLWKSLLFYTEIFIETQTKLFLFILTFNILQEPAMTRIFLINIYFKMFVK